MSNVVPFRTRVEVETRSVGGVAKYGPHEIAWTYMFAGATVRLDLEGLADFSKADFQVIRDAINEQLQVPVGVKVAWGPVKEEDP